MPRNKTKKKASGGESYNQCRRRVVREQAQRSRLLQHVDKSEDYPIAVWNHEWRCYVMDDYSGFWVLSTDIKQQLLAAWDVWRKKWDLFRRLTDEEMYEKMERKVEEGDDRPF